MGKGVKFGIAFAILCVVAIGGFAIWLNAETRPLVAERAEFVRYNKPTPFDKVAGELQDAKILRNASAATLMLKLRRRFFVVPIGTYEVRASMTLDELSKTLHNPMRRMFRIPETNLSYRTANLLDKYMIADANEYNALVKDPKRFKSAVGFTLPYDNLEGYLYPDTYDIPPLIGAEAVVQRQLKNWVAKIAPLLPDVNKRRKFLTIASMIELEAGSDEDRPMISGVIHNRLAKNMKLEIDATVLYARQEWRRLFYKDYTSTISPYNTYLHKGLPPGPICSPTVASVKAALNPAKHDFLYYVAKPDGKHLFGKTFDEHKRNIAIARKMRGDRPLRMVRP